MITKKLAVEKIAIVGLGGTGSYVLDLLAKTPAKEIHLFDGDKFSPHNAFRAPGAASIQDLKKQPLKVEYFEEVYSRLHLRINAHAEHVTETNVEQLRDMACVFLCIDSGPGKKLIVDKLEEFGVLFIDVGMGLYAAHETLGGILRVTTSEPDNREVARARMSFAATDENNEYDKNIQIADLNALNATLAVIRWKKLRGFYFDHKHERFSSFTIGSNMLLSEDIHESHRDN
jgi:molybdopterin/thiamine biosynthesis adenylyltransferase